MRTVADLPRQGVAVRLELHARRFFCPNQLCPQHIFCERLPAVVTRYARRTARLEEALRVTAGPVPIREQLLSRLFRNESVVSSHSVARDFQLAGDTAQTLAARLQLFD